MKKIIRFCFLTVLILSFTGLANAQTFWEETFDVDPGTWTLDNNWSIADGKLTLFWNPPIDGYDLSAISPTIPLPDNTGDLIVTQYVNEYSENGGEIVEISVLFNGDEDILWSFALVGQDWGYDGGQDISFSLVDYAGLDIQLRFRSYGGSTFNFDEWNIYNVAINGAFDNDLAAIQVLGPSAAEVNVEEIWSVTVKNVGMNSIDSYTVKLFMEGDIELGSIDVSTTLEPTEEAEFDFCWTPMEVGPTYLYGQTVMSGDEFEGNDISPNYDVYVFAQGALTALIWDNDNNSHYIDPETGNSVGCEYGLQQALSANGINFTTVTTLPSNLTGYDIVFVELGLYCVG